MSRGDMIVRSNNRPGPVQDIEVIPCSLNNNPAKLRSKYSIRYKSNKQKVMINEVAYNINIESLGRKTEFKDLKMNYLIR